MKLSSGQSNLVIGLVVSCLASVLFLFVRVISSDSSRYIFLFWNLILAAVPLLLAWWLVYRIREHGWFHWKQVLLSVVWLVFLPNSFYLLTDFVHLRLNSEASLYFDVIMLASFVLNGLILGYLSLFLVHKELRKRFSEVNALGIVGLILFSVSFAIYLGRFTRWNTWDLLLQPAGLLFDVSDRFVNPAQHSGTYTGTIAMFILLFTVYFVIWGSAKALKK